MAVFKDQLGNEWTVQINVLNVRNLRENMDPPINLMDPNSLAELFSDECLQYEVLWRLVEKQAKEKRVNEEAFAVIFTESFVDAVKAMTEALSNFFLSCGRAELSRLIEKTLLASKRLQDLAVKNLNSTEMDQMIDRMVAEKETQMMEAMNLTTNTN